MMDLYLATVSAEASGLKPASRFYLCLRAITEIHYYTEIWLIFYVFYLFQEMETQSGSKSMPGRGVTLQMLLEEKMLEPGNAAMTIEYLVSIIFFCQLC